MSDGEPTPARADARGADRTAYLSGFDAYLEKHECQPIHGANVRCGGCLRTDLRCWVRARTADIACEACLRYSFGYDQGQGRTIRVMVAAAVSSLIDESDPDVAEDALVDGLHDARTGRVKLRED